MPVNYKDGKIYLVLNDLNDTIYVGSTALLRLSSRMAGHRSSAVDQTSAFYVAMRTLGVAHFTIRLHHAFPCFCRAELLAEEMKTLDALIAAGRTVYNHMVAGKHAAETREKMSITRKGEAVSDDTKKKIAAAMTGKIQEANGSFSMGYIALEGQRCPSWKFGWRENGKARKKSFSVKKYGNYGAHWRCEELRRQIYPEWGNDEDIACDDLGHIEWD
jgi:hypothetical protein